MGNKASRASHIGDKAAKQFAANSGFSIDEVRALHAQFLSLKVAEVPADEAAVSLAEFTAALGGGGSSRFLERVFALFDANRDGVLSFDEFLAGLAVLSPNAPPEAKLRFVFNIYDMDGRGRITPDNLKALLASSLAENGVALSDAAVSALVNGTFKAEDADRDGVINFEEWRGMVTRQPGLLKPLNVNVAELIAGAHTPTTTTMGSGPGAMPA